MLWLFILWSNLDCLSRLCCADSKRWYLNFQPEAQCRHFESVEGAACGAISHFLSDVLREKSSCVINTWTRIYNLECSQGS